MSIDCLQPVLAPAALAARTTGQAAIPSSRSAEPTHGTPLGAMSAEVMGILGNDQGYSSTHLIKSSREWGSSVSAGPGVSRGGPLVQCRGRVGPSRAPSASLTRCAARTLDRPPRPWCWLATGRPLPSGARPQVSAGLTGESSRATLRRSRSGGGRIQGAPSEAFRCVLNGLSRAPSRPPTPWQPKPTALRMLLLDTSDTDPWSALRRSELSAVAPARPPWPPASSPCTPRCCGCPRRRSAKATTPDIRSTSSPRPRSSSSRPSPAVSRGPAPTRVRGSRRWCGLRTRCRSSSLRQAPVRDGGQQRGSALRLSSPGARHGGRGRRCWNPGRCGRSPLSCGLIWSRSHRPAPRPPGLHSKAPSGPAPSTSRRREEPARAGQNTDGPFHWETVPSGHPAAPGPSQSRVPAHRDVVRRHRRARRPGAPSKQVNRHLEQFPHMPLAALRSWSPSVDTSPHVRHSGYRSTPTCHVSRTSAD